MKVIFEVVLDPIVLEKVVGIVVLEEVPVSEGR